MNGTIGPDLEDGMADTYEQIVQKIYDTPKNTAPKGWIHAVLNSLYDAGYVIVEAPESPTAPKRRPNCF